MSLQSTDQISLPSDPTAAMEAATKQYVDAAAPAPDYISGLKLSYVDATHVSVGTGAWADPATGQLVRLATAATKQPGAGSLFWHLYGVSTGVVEISSTAPAVPYFGTARGHPTLSGRRYLGSVLVGANNAVVPFAHCGDSIMYRVNALVAPALVVSAGNSTTWVNVPLSGIVPASANAVFVNALSFTSAARVYVSGSTTSYQSTVIAYGNESTFAKLAIDPNLTIAYENTAAGSAYISIMGYEFER